jgi:hypothetical protein
VVLPWSTCAIIATFLSLSFIILKVSPLSVRIHKPLLYNKKYMGAMRMRREKYWLSVYNALEAFNDFK